MAKVNKDDVGFWSGIGAVIGAAAHSAHMCEEVAYAGHQFTAGLPELAEQSSELLNAKALEALQEQRKLTAPPAGQED